LSKPAKKFVKENKLEAVEGKKFIDEAVKHAEATKNELFKKINETAKKAAVDKMGLITHKEIANLKKRNTRYCKNLCSAKNVYKVKNEKKTASNKVKK
jgi:polyhydroxyalkanoate synthesis regulator phasin